MTYKSLLMPVQPRPGCTQALPAIIAFAQAQKADLTAICARAPIYLADPWIVSGEIVEQLTAEEQAQFKEAETCFTKASACLDGKAHFRISRDYPNTAIADEAAGADLIVVVPERGGEGSTLNLPELVMNAGVPILVVPTGTQAIHTDSIMIAWRNTADARHAVAAALPALKAADTVSVVQIVRSEDADEAWVGLRAVRELLRLHGVKAEADIIFRDNNEEDADVILNAARERMVDLIVMGGYGHSRAREWMLGGVTRDLLTNSPFPLLVAH